MPSADITQVLEASPPAPVVFAAIDEAPVRPGENFGPCLLGPGGNSDWVTGYWNGTGWYGDDGIALSPQWWALLPPVPGSPEQLSRLITAVISNGEYDYAARLIDELADEVARLRDG
jgi:hypothetical protein